MMEVPQAVLHAWRRFSMRPFMRPWTAPRAFEKWDRAGRPVPAPPIVKQTIVNEYRQRFALRVLVETGTFQGEMIEAMLGRFDRIYSIELDGRWFDEARRRFGRRRDVRLLHGDSGTKLREVLAEIDRPALFWLDAHYSGPATARGPLDSPIAQELEAIRAHPVAGHVILIDDVSYFTGIGGYPELATLIEALRIQYPGAVVEVRDDILRMHGSR
jgi:hypothetical protein